MNLERAIGIEKTYQARMNICFAPFVSRLVPHRMGMEL